MPLFLIVGGTRSLDSWNRGLWGPKLQGSRHRWLAQGLGAVS